MNKVLFTTLAACIAVTAQAQTFDFDALSVGQLSGQGGWIVEGSEAALSSVAAGGLFGNTNGNHLALSGSSVPSPKMNRWLAVPVTLSGATYVTFEYTMAASGNTDPSELFFGFHTNAATTSAPWSAYVALKHPNNGTNPIGIEGTGSGGVIANGGVALNTDTRVTALFGVDGSNILNNISVWINPSLDGNGIPSNAADLSWAVSGSLNLANQTLLKIRAQNMPTLIDNVAVVPEPGTYAALLGLLALGVVAVRRRFQK